MLFTALVSVLSLTSDWTTGERLRGGLALALRMTRGKLTEKFIMVCILIVNISVVFLYKKTASEIILVHLTKV